MITEGTMGHLSVWHWLIVLVFVLLMVIPWAMITHKAGYSRWWSIPFVIPGLGIIALWVFAFARWPAIRR
jgi:hypothetical protein